MPSLPTGNGVSYPAPISESDPSWGPVQSFLRYLHGSILCYIPDAESVKSLPIIHSDTLDLDHQSEGYGVFYSVNGFKSTASRREDNLLCVNAFYVDIDWPKERLGAPSPQALAEFKRDALAALSDLAMDGMIPTFIIETKNGFHGLWCFEEPIIIDNLSDEKRTQLFKSYRETQLAIIDRLQGDPGAKDVARVLRLPNTYHLKDPAFPFLVKIAHSSGERYTFKQVRQFFCKTKQREVKELGDLTWKEAGNGNEPIPKSVLEELNRVYPKSDRPSIQALMRLDGISPGSRNESLFVAVSALRESGWSEAQCLGHFTHYNGLSAYEIGSVIKSAYARATPYETGWNHPLVAAGMTEVERAKVTSIISTALAEHRTTKRAERKPKEIIEDNQRTVEITVADPRAKDEKTAELARAQIEREEKKDQALAKAYQKKLYERYEHVILERFPSLRYVVANSFYNYENGAYIPVDMKTMQAMILNEMEKDGLSSYRTKTHVDNKILCLQAQEWIVVDPKDVDPDPNVVNVRNGLVDLDTGELKPHDPVYFSTNQLAEITYQSDKLVSDIAPRWLRFVKEITEGDDGKAALLQEMAGYCFTRSVAFQRAFILFGSGANGKSTFVDILAKILGRRNSSSLTLKDLHEQFGPAKLFGKTLNVVEEINNNYVESDYIKKVITGAEITADRKFIQDPLVFRPYAKFVFAVNSLPKINDTSMGLYRRFTIIEFGARFSPNSEPHLHDKLWAERDGVFLWAMEGWKRLRAQGVFTMTEAVLAASEHFKESNSPLVEFMLANYAAAPLGREDKYMIPLRKLFDAYQKGTRELGYQPKNYQNFVKEIGSLNHGRLSTLSITEIDEVKYVVGIQFKTKPNL